MIESKLLLFLTSLYILPYLAAHQKKNIILVLTDDQDLHLNSLSAMKHTQNLIANKGVTFTNTFVTTPICCPSRSTLLTGQYAHNHGTWNNSISGGCSDSKWQTHSENRTFAQLLNKNGYRTMYAGKYLNQYGNKATGGTQHVPKGWDWWIGLVGNSRYYNYTLSINGTGRRYTDDYLTDVINSYAMEFLNQNDIKTKPFLMVLASPAPHAPFTPARRHQDSLPNVKVLKTPAFNATTVGKHWLLRMTPVPLPPQAEVVMDGIQRNRHQTLLAVDEMVNNLVQRLEELDILNNTYIMFTSDNGYHIGQFSQAWDKRQPYETDIAVPLLVRGPNIKEKSLIQSPVANIDIAPTILAMAGLHPSIDFDGVSFLNVITKQRGKSYNRKILIEYSGEENKRTVSKNCPWKYDTHLSECYEDFWCKCQDSKNNSYVCVRHITTYIDNIYCAFFDSENFIEMYDLRTDPYQLTNLNSGNLNFLDLYSNDLKTLQKCLGRNCNI